MAKVFAAHWKDLEIPVLEEVRLAVSFLALAGCGRHPQSGNTFMYEN